MLWCFLTGDQHADEWSLMHRAEERGGRTRRGPRIPTCRWRKSESCEHDFRGGTLAVPGWTMQLEVGD